MWLLKTLFPKEVRFWLMFFSVFVLTACAWENELLFDNLNQSSANQVLLILGQNDINAKTEATKDGTYSVYVPSNKKYEALKILSQKGMPRSPFVDIGEVFKKDGFISSPQEEQARFIFALNQQISSMISSINGVIEVKTNVSLPSPTDNLWGGSISPLPSASVLIRYQYGTKVDLYVSHIKSLVSNSVPGLTIDRVEILTIVDK